MLFTTEMVGLYFISSVLSSENNFRSAAIRHRRLGRGSRIPILRQILRAHLHGQRRLTAFALYAKNVTASTPDDFTASASVSSLLAAEKDTRGASPPPFIQTSVTGASNRVK